MRTLFNGAAGAVLVGLFLVSGCGTPRETVEVAERPPAPTDTVVGPTDTLTVEGTVSDRVPIPSGYDTVQAGRFDRGKLWPFDQVPRDYFQAAYGVEADSQWLGRARRGALRFGDNCSASFVSATGLVMTNHHCARESISSVGEKGEKPLKNGFYADSIGAERAVEGLHVDQLLAIENVTAQVVRGKGPRGNELRGNRQQRADRLEDVLTQRAKEDDERLRVDVMAFYHGAKYAAYTYRRYEDVRLVMAPELQMGYFGGETDNFTYPRYSLDIAFFRVYAGDGTPLRPDHYFSWETEGAEPGEPVFVVGNPGATNRLEMVSQWTYDRDYRLPARLEVFEDRQGILGSYITNHPEAAGRYGLQNTYFSLRNTIKSLKGQLEGLQDPYLMARRAKAVQALRDSIAAVDSLRQYNRVVAQIKQLQQSKRILANKHKAFVTFASVQLGSRILSRAVHGYYYDFLRTRGADPERVESIRTDAVRISNWPSELEAAMLSSQLKELRTAFGPDHPTMQKLFRTRSPDSLASHLVGNSALTDSVAFTKLLDDGYLKSDDPSVSVIEALAPLFLNTNRQMEDIRRTEASLNRRLSKARRAIYGEQVPPEANFSLRISDGVVKGYTYNGTSAPPFTNFYGLYDRYYSHSGTDWALPERWVEPPDSLDLDTPLNLVSTNDISGGSSGSPLLNSDLEVVGVVFDSNMQALPNDYLYRDREGRAISVDVRGILEVLDDVYGATRLVQEVTGERPAAVPRPSASRSQ
jgi:hypothetical protein